MAVRVISSKRFDTVRGTTPGAKHEAKPINLTPKKMRKATLKDLKPGKRIVLITSLGPEIITICDRYKKRDYNTQTDKTVFDLSVERKGELYCNKYHSNAYNVSLKDLKESINTAYKFKIK